MLRGRRPAVAHALWLLVLLKLVTPPLWTVRVPWFRASTAEVDRAAVSQIERAAASPASDVDGVDVSFDELTGTEAPLAEPADYLVSTHAAAPVVAGRAVAASAAERLGDRVTTAIAISWLVGSVSCLALVIFRTIRFRRLLRHATPALPPVARRAAALSRRLGITSPPAVWFVPGAVCPMLWAVVGRPRLLLPEGLWDDLDEAQRDTLVAHELAHLRRRDHWVRLVEVAATVLYWWHPAAWWARRELREAEEQCCDAWVVWSMPRCARPYMNAILMAVDFVSEAAAECAGRARVAVPPVASGMASGEFRHLERRLSMIRQNETCVAGPAGRTLGRAALAAVCAAAVGLLPLAPTLAQQEPQQPQAPRGITVITAPHAGNSAAAPRAEVQFRPTSSAASAGAPEGVPRAATIELRTPDGLVAVQTTPEAAVGLPGGPPAAVDGASITFSAAPAAEGDRGRNDVDRARLEVQRLSAELEAARARLAMAEAVAWRGGNGGNRGTPAPRAPMGGGGTSFRGGEPDAPPSARRAQRGGAGPDQQRRLDELERKLDRLLDEVQNLKQGRQGHGEGHGESEKPAVSRAF
jgi:beta-lactamase regulating signal transducer with metallopeptidase domain